MAEQLKQMYQKVVAIGDGVTDMEACPPAVSTKYRRHHMKMAKLKFWRKTLFDIFPITFSTRVSCKNSRAPSQSEMICQTV